MLMEIHVEFTDADDGDTFGKGVVQVVLDEVERLRDSDRLDGDIIVTTVDAPE